MTAAEARRAIDPIAKRFGGDVQNQAEYADAAAGGLDFLLGLVYVLLLLAIVIALLGIANTLSLAVYERRREIGLLRAVGETRRQVRSMLRLESVIVSSFGTLVGVVAGAFIGWSLFEAIAQRNATFSVPRCTTHPRGRDRRLRRRARGLATRPPCVTRGYPRRHRRPMTTRTQREQRA